MQFESVYPFLLIIAPFAIAFFAEALVIYFFRLKAFWPSLGIAVTINLITLLVLFASSMLLGKLGYAFNGLRLPVQVMLFLWWLSIIADALLLTLFARRVQPTMIYYCSMVMNTISYLFLYFFITNSH